MPLRSGLHSLWPGTRRPRVIYRCLKPLTSGDPLCSLDFHQVAHLAAKLGRHLAVGECLLNRCGELTLSTNLSSFPVAADTLDVIRLNSPDGFPKPLRCRSSATNLQSRPLLRSCFTVADGGTNVYTIEKNGVRKMIYQTPWRVDGVVGGLAEISMEIPAEMPHYIRN